MIINESKKITESLEDDIKKLVGATSDNCTIEIPNYDANLISKKLKSLGCKKVVKSSVGWGFPEEIFAYENTNPDNSRFIMELKPLKNDNEFSFKINKLK